MGNSKGEVTQLLDRVARGDRSAENALMPRVYLELHRIATTRLKSERHDHTLQPTALVHEAYLKICRSDFVGCESRAQFFGYASTVMRRILVDYARQRKACKRDGGVSLPLDDAIVFSPDQTAQALEIDELLNQLEKMMPRAAKVVEAKFFGGLNEEEVAEAIGKDTRTVRRDWKIARAWLHQQLHR